MTIYASQDINDHIMLYTHHDTHQLARYLQLITVIDLRENDLPNPKQCQGWMTSLSFR